VKTFVQPGPSPIDPVSNLAYNVLNQLTSITAGSAENLTYDYPTGTNNG
jgi:hypothetical protein